MFWRKKHIQQIKVERTNNLLMVQLYINHIREARIQCIIEPEKTIFICDIIHDNDINIDKGYGSAMMEMLISYAIENGYSRLYGNLSYVDIDHKDRLYHFYKKYDFVITEHASKQGCFWGRIDKQL